MRHSHMREREREKCYPHLARKANLGSAHRCLVASGAAVPGCTEDGAAQAMHTCTHAACTRTHTCGTTIRHRTVRHKWQSNQENCSSRPHFMHNSEFNSDAANWNPRREWRQVAAEGAEFEAKHADVRRKTRHNCPGVPQRPQLRPQGAQLGSTDARVRAL
jgi:hypothetical protein